MKIFLQFLIIVFIGVTAGTILTAGILAFKDFMWFVHGSTEPGTFLRHLAIGFNLSLLASLLATCVLFFAMWVDGKFEETPHQKASKKPVPKEPKKEPEPDPREYQGVVLNKPNLKEDPKRIVNSELAVKTVLDLRKHGMNYSNIAKVLNEMGLCTTTGLEFDQHRARTLIQTHERGTMRKSVRMAKLPPSSYNPKQMIVHRKELGKNIEDIIARLRSEGKTFGEIEIYLREKGLKGPKNVYLSKSAIKNRHYKHNKEVKNG